MFWICKLNVIKISDIFKSFNPSYVCPFACLCKSVRVMSVLENKWKFLRHITFTAFVYNSHTIYIIYVQSCILFLAFVTKDVADTRIKSFDIRYISMLYDSILLQIYVILKRKFSVFFFMKTKFS